MPIFRRDRRWLRRRARGRGDFVVYYFLAVYRGFGSGLMLYKPTRAKFFSLGPVT